MTREELEHIIRASGEITDQYEFVIIGSQSMLGPVSSPEEVFLVSMEAASTRSWPLSSRTRSTVSSEKARSSTRPTATMPRELAQILPLCLRIGCNECTESKTATQTIEWDTAWTCSTSS